MHYTSEELKTKLYKHLKTNIKDDISGDIYKDRRPYDSQQEDIVINALPSNAQFLQTAVFNVNCYVPLITTNKIKEQVINHKRINEIAKKLLPLLNDVWAETFNIQVDFHHLIDHNDECYYNFRIKINAWKNNTQ